MGKTELRNFLRRMAGEKEIKVITFDGSSFFGTVMEAREDAFILDETRALGDMVSIGYETVKSVVA